MQRGSTGGNHTNGNSRRTVVAQVWVKVTPTGDPHPRAAELIGTIKERYPDADVRVEQEPGYVDRAMMRVYYAEGARATAVGESIQGLIRDFRGGGDANLLTGKVFSLKVPIGPKGEIANARAQSVVEEIKRQFSKADVEQHNEGKVGTVDIYMRDITDAQRFMVAYRAVRDIVRRHKSET